MLKVEDLKSVPLFLGQGHSPKICRSRGFAFIVFKELAGIEAALAQTAHVVKGKKVNAYVAQD